MVSDFQVKDGQVPMILDLGSSWKPGRHQPAGLCGFVKELCASLTIHFLPPVWRDVLVGSAETSSPRGQQSLYRITARLFPGFDMNFSLPDLCFC